MYLLPSAWIVVAALAFNTTSIPSPAPTWCSIGPFPDSRDPKATYFVGSARPDTLLAGPGEVAVSELSGHWGRGQRPHIFGQVVAVQRLGGAESAQLAEVLARRRSTQVLVVPWDYDASCRTAAWTRSARFAPVDTTGMFTVRLRPEEHWVGGMPTFDAFMAGLEPYPYALFYRHGYRGTDALWTQPSLTPGEFFAFYRGLPDHDLIRNDPDAAAAMLDAWSQKHPHLAKKYPAAQILERARRSIGRSRTSSIPAPGHRVAGDAASASSRAADAPLPCP